MTIGRLIAFGQVTLVLADGQKITVLSKGKENLPGYDRAKVLVRGSVPGFGHVI
jgi:hypothetical protein